MGVQRKSRRRKFNGPPGRHSYNTKRKYDRASQKINQSLSEMLKKYIRKPYKIVRRVVFDNGQKKLKLVVQRIKKCNIIDKQSALQSVCSRDSAKLTIFSQNVNESLEGYRLIDITLMNSFISDVSIHSATCAKAQQYVNNNNKSPITLCMEKNKCGLSSDVVFVCVCGHRMLMSTSKSTAMSDGSMLHDINLRAVWGTMATGGGASSLNEKTSTLNMPGISPSYFSLIESKITSMWDECLQEDMMLAGAEERDLAIKRGDFHDGVPAITVVCDGGWSKRSHKHTYNALGGVGVIIGAETGKVLHVGVRNKMCYTCTLAETRQVAPAPHVCFKNWSESSQAMESDIIAEGFKKSESVHGVRYMRVVADGDSSVFARIQQTVPVWGRHVEKIECSNHSCKCLRASLEKLVEDKPHYKGKGGLTKRVRIRLVSAVRCAIRMRSAENNKVKASKQLNHDIRNSIHHIFGDHTRCSDFCKTATSRKGSNSADNGDNITDSNNTVEITTIIQEQLRYSTEGLSEKDLEESRLAFTSEISLRSDMLHDISILLDRMASKSKRLLGNFTTNTVESWMAIRAKFDGGKIYNRCNRGSWNGRCYGGALRKNFGPAWSPIVWQRTVRTKPGMNFIAHFRRRSIDLMKSTRSKMKPDVKERKRKRKLASINQSNTKKARTEYGSDALAVISDISVSELEKRCKDYNKTSIQLTNQQCKKIEELTRDQSLSVTWKEERKKRLTSSNFGIIVHRNPKLSVKKLVSRLLYSNFKGTCYTRNGLNSESITITEYIELKRKEKQEVKVNRCGLVIDLKNKHLAASPDAIVTQIKNGEKGLLEIKNLLQNNQFSFTEACTKVKNFCLEYNGGKLQLKNNHNYYYQIQGQMNILELPWTDIMIRRTNPYEIFIERVYKNVKLWKDEMIPKLTAFYFKAVLPELAAPRDNTSTGIREPDLPWYVGSNCCNGKVTKPKTRQKKQEKVDQEKSHTGDFNTDKETVRRGKRVCATKFVGRRISHEWCVDEDTGRTQWYSGRVLDVIKGKNGDPKAVYEVLYDGENCPHEVDNLHEDYASSSLKFIDC